MRDPGDRAMDERQAPDVAKVVDVVASVVDVIQVEP
jgi:hypothetical protein